MAANQNVPLLFDPGSVLEGGRGPGLYIMPEVERGKFSSWSCALCSESGTVITAAAVVTVVAPRSAPALAPAPALAATPAPAAAPAVAPAVASAAAVAAVAVTAATAGARGAAFVAG